MSKQHRKWAPERHNSLTKHKIQRVKPENETVSSESSTSEDKHLYACHNTKSSKVLSAKVKINKVRVKMLIDTGASIDIMDETTFAHINNLKSISLQQANTKLFAY